MPLGNVVCALKWTSSAYPSCRRRNNKWIVAMNKWQDLTDMEVNKGEQTLGIEIAGFANPSMDGHQRASICYRNIAASCSCMQPMWRVFVKGSMRNWLRVSDCGSTPT